MKNNFLLFPIAILSLSFVLPCEKIACALPADGKDIYRASISTVEKTNTKHLNYINAGDYLDQYKGDQVTIAIIDSGVNVNHEDFFDSNGNSIISNLSASFINNNYNYVVTTYVKDKGLECINDTNGHGTNVAGIIAAQANGKGIVGIAPNVNLMILKTDYTFNAMNAALRYAADNGADIINMSIQSYTQNVTYGSQTMQAVPGANTLLTQSLNYAYDKGCLIVAAAGNYNTNVKSYPAANEHVLGVGSLASGSMTLKAGFSNYGTYVDLVAPGYVYTTAIGSSTSYTSTQGTSFSAPIVTAAAALFKSKIQEATNKDIEDFILKSCDYISSDSSLSEDEKQFGAGSINFTKLLKEINSITLQGTAPLHVDDLGEIEFEIFPSDAVFTKLEWISSDENVVLVDDGVLLGVGYGTAKIKAKALDGSNVVSNEIEVSVVPNETDYIKISNYKTEFNIGDEFTFHKSADDKAIVHLFVDGKSVNDVIDFVTHNSIDMSVPGKKEVVVNYKGYLEDKYEIVVYDEAISSLRSELENIDFEQVTVNDKDKILELYNDYLSLSEEQKTCVDATELLIAVNKIENAEKVESISNSITDIKDEFKTVRLVENDLSTLTEKVNRFIEEYNNLDDSLKTDEMRNYFNAYNKAFDFMVRWYQQVRVVNPKTRSSLLSICDALHLDDGKVMKKFINEYNSFDTLTQSIINDAYDTTGDDGSFISIGNSIKYASNVIALNKVGVRDNDLEALVQTNDVNLVMILFVTIGLFVVSILAILIKIVFKKKKIKIN